MSSTGTALGKTRWAKGLATTRKGWGTEARHQEPITNLYNQFMLRCEREGLTERSKKAYEWSVPKLLKFFEHREFWQNITQKDAEDWISHVQTLSVSDHTKQGWLRTTKVVWRFAAAQGLTDFTGVIPKLKKLKGRQYLPSPQVLNTFLNKFDQSTVWGFRDYVVAMTILSCGARIGEICGMAPEDVLWDQGKLRLFGKGRKERFVKIDADQLLPLLKKWEQVRKEYVTGNGQDRMFISRNGGRCHPNTFAQSFKKHRDHTGLGKEAQGTLSPHTLRHYFCSHFLLDGGNPFALKVIAGHSDLSTTLGYVSETKQSDIATLEHDKVAPLKRLLEAGEIGAEAKPKKWRKMN